MEQHILSVRERSAVCAPTLMGEPAYHYVSRETSERLSAFVKMVVAENDRQNLVSKSTVKDIWVRHIDDALQLVPYLIEGPIVDVGSGAGFPGMVLACSTPADTILVEPRNRRAEFLSRVTESLGLANVTVMRSRIEAVRDIQAANLTARAVTSLVGLFGSAMSVTTPETRWILPKGRSAESELAAARLSWQGRFELVRSRTDPDAWIVVAEDVRKRT